MIDFIVLVFFAALLPVLFVVGSVFEPDRGSRTKIQIVAFLMAGAVALASCHVYQAMHLSPPAAEAAP